MILGDAGRQLNAKSAIITDSSARLYLFNKGRTFVIVNSMSKFVSVARRKFFTPFIAILALVFSAPAIMAETREGGGEAALKLPDLSGVNFLGFTGNRLLLIGLFISLLGWLFGLAIYVQLKNLPVHRSMREISELIYETCKTYLITQGKFILVLWVFIAAIVVAYFGVL